MPPPPAEPFRFLSLALLPPLFRFRPVLFFFFPGSGGVCGHPLGRDRDRLVLRLLCAPAAPEEAARDRDLRLLLDRERARFGLSDLDRRSLSLRLWVRPSDNDRRRRLREGDRRRPEALLERDFTEVDREPDADRLARLPRLVASSTDLDRLLLLLPSLLPLSLLAIARPLFEGCDLAVSTSTASSSSSPELTESGGEGGVLGIALALAPFPPFFLFLFFFAVPAAIFLDFAGGTGLFGGSTAFRFLPFPGGSCLFRGGGGVDLRLFSTGDSLVKSLSPPSLPSSDKLGVPSLSLWIVTRKFSNFPPPRPLDFFGFLARRGGGVISRSSSSSSDPL